MTVEIELKRIADALEKAASSNSGDPNMNMYRFAHSFAKNLELIVNTEDQFVRSRMLRAMVRDTYAIAEKHAAMALQSTHGKESEARKRSQVQSSVKEDGLTGPRSMDRP